MRRYQNQYGYTINVDPWFNMGYRLVSVELVEVLGGGLARGILRMIGSQSNLESLMIRESLHTGTFSILKSGTVVKEFKVFFNSRTYKREMLTLGFVCIPDPKYVRDLITQSYRGELQDIIQSIFTEEGFLDIRCMSDIQGEIRLYQTNESDISFLERILSGYRRNSVYGYSWEHLIIKETCTPEEIKSAPIVEAMSEEQSPATKKYTKSLYNASRNRWEESEDYSKSSPINVTSTSFMGGRIGYASPQHQDLVMNSKKNIANLGSSYFQRLTITLKALPSYQIGNVVQYYRVDNQNSHLIWPYKYYLVYGNRMFFSTSGTGVTDPMVPKNQGNYTFSTVLVGLEEDGSIALDKTEEQDPTLKDQGDPNYLNSIEEVGISSNIKKSTSSGIPKITPESIRSSSNLEKLTGNKEDAEKLGNLFLQYGQEQGLI